MHGRVKSIDIDREHVQDVDMQDVSTDIDILK